MVSGGAQIALGLPGGREEAFPERGSGRAIANLQLARESLSANRESELEDRVPFR